MGYEREEEGTEEGEKEKGELGSSVNNESILTLLTASGRVVDSTFTQCSGLYCLF